MTIYLFGTAGGGPLPGTAGGGPLEGTEGVGLALTGGGGGGTLRPCLGAKLKGVPGVEPVFELSVLDCLGGSEGGTAGLMGRFSGGTIAGGGGQAPSGGVSNGRASGSSSPAVSLGMVCSTPLTQALPDSASGS